MMTLVASAILVASAWFNPSGRTSEPTYIPVFAVAPTEVAIPKQNVPPLTADISEKSVVRLNAVFSGKRAGERVYLFSRSLPRLVQLRMRFELATEVLALLSKGAGSGTAGLFPLRQLSSDSQSAFTTLTKEFFGMDADAEHLRSQKFGFTVQARASFHTSIGTLRVPFAGNPDGDPGLDNFGDVISNTGVVRQDPRITYERGYFPESRNSSYRVALGYHPEISLDSQMCRTLQEVIDEVYEADFAEYEARLEETAKAVFRRNPKYFEDIVNKGSLSETQVGRYQQVLKKQLLEQGFLMRRVEDIVSNSRSGRRELQIFASAYLNVSGKDKQLTGPASLFIWP